MSGDNEVKELHTDTHCWSLLLGEKRQFSVSSIFRPQQFERYVTYHRVSISCDL